MLFVLVGRTNIFRWLFRFGDWLVGLLRFLCCNKSLPHSGKTAQGKARLTNLSPTFSVPRALLPRYNATWHFRRRPSRGKARHLLSLAGNPKRWRAPQEKESEKINKNTVQFKNGSRRLPSSGSKDRRLKFLLASLQQWKKDQE